MAHFAELNDNNIVVAVWVITNPDILDENGVEVEQLGINLCKELYGEEKRFVQTSYNHNFRYRYAIIGFLYDEVHDAFMPQKPYPSWQLDTSEMLFVAPVPYPSDGLGYSWDEDTLSWYRDPDQDPIDLYEET